MWAVATGVTGGCSDQGERFAVHQVHSAFGEAVPSHQRTLLATNEPLTGVRRLFRMMLRPVDGAFL
jgi:hypothetical protein